MRYQEEIAAVKDKIASIEAEKDTVEEKLGAFYAEAGRTIAEAGGLDAWPDLNDVYRSLNEKKAALSESARILREKVSAVLPADQAEAMEIPALQEELLKLGKRMEQEGARLLSEQKEEKALREALSAASEKQKELLEAKNTASEAFSESRSDLMAADARVQELLKRRSFPSLSEAETALLTRQKENKKAEAIYQTARENADALGRKLSYEEALLSRCRTELPGLLEEERTWKAHYDSKLVEKKLEEQEFQAISEKYPQEMSASIRQEILSYREKRAAAEGAKNAAEKAVSGHEKPDLEMLSQAFREAEDACEKQSAALGALERMEETDREGLTALRRLLQGRSRIMKEFQMIDRLYSRLSGKTSGARMDLETYVQRWYLQQVLYAANRRFYEMTGGQFELRLVPEEEAGEGRNRGLDFMVYSAVTGTEREVRTLSGGESFMAALSLALGMADAIRARSGGVNLDIMFIDEGFGSLDDDSREKAVRILQEMAGPGRLVGLISHVTELKQKIEDKLLVTRDDQGSHVRWQLS